MNASRKTTDNQRCNVTDSISIPEDLGNIHDIRSLADSLVTQVYKLYPDDKERLQTEVRRLMEETQKKEAAEGLAAMT
eukprot:5286343-Prymnesium_polylepis.1